MPSETKQLGRGRADLIDRVDAAAAKAGVSRAKYIDGALEAALGGANPHRNDDGPSPVASGLSAQRRLERPAVFKCPRDCRKSFRPTSANNRCPVCRKPVVPA